MGGFYAQDRWRIRRSLTLNNGLRWKIQGPMKDYKGLTASPDLASIYGPSQRLFAPGELSGKNNPAINGVRLANGKEQFSEVTKGNIRSASFDLNGLWSP